MSAPHVVSPCSTFNVIPVGATHLYGLHGDPLAVSRSFARLALQAPPFRSPCTVAASAALSDLAPDDAPAGAV